VVRDAVAAFLSALASPFTTVADAPGSSKLEALGPAVGAWLMDDALGPPLALFAGNRAADEAQVRAARLFGAGAGASLPPYPLPPPPRRKRTLKPYHQLTSSEPSPQAWRPAAT
jgi:hypothetical protein